MGDSAFSMYNQNYASSAYRPASSPMVNSYGGYPASTQSYGMTNSYGQSALTNPYGGLQHRSGGAGDASEASKPAATEPLSGGVTMGEAAKAAGRDPKADGFELYSNIPAEYFAYYTYRSVRCGIVASVLITFALFIITIGALANILATGDGWEKWGWAFMWGFGILFFIIGLVFLFMCWNQVPADLTKKTTENSGRVQAGVEI
jgi:hypothetical protein